MIPPGMMTQISHETITKSARGSTQLTRWLEDSSHNNAWTPAIRSETLRNRRLETARACGCKTGRGVGLWEVAAVCTTVAYGAIPFR
jgi:hypothetical protein